MYAEGVTFIDVRSPRQYKKRHIAGAVHLYIKDAFTEQNLSKLGPKETALVIYCNGAHCSLSYKAAEKAVAWGYTNIKYYRDGFRAWRLDGNPLEYVMPK
jgi:rhodanese-related sulfurtransferase